MDEALKVLRSLWRGGSQPVSFHGKYYHFDQLVFSPATVQLGGPPLWVAGNSPAALRRAVILADGWHADSLPAPSLAQLLSTVRPMLAQRPFTVSMRTSLARHAAEGDDRSLSGSPEEVIQQLRAYEQAGLDTVIFSVPTETQAERERMLKGFAQDVIPALRPPNSR
jgi:alkanesulfonate monooxygenase SsuD/methylene tetrahydromethanopterin reductase-like flavin-dependent oxidoreductase (luciferase family)